MRRSKIGRPHEIDAGLRGGDRGLKLSRLEFFGYDLGIGGEIGGLDESGLRAVEERDVEIRAIQPRRYKWDLQCGDEATDVVRQREIRDTADVSANEQGDGEGDDEGVRSVTACAACRGSSDFFRSRGDSRVAALH